MINYATRLRAIAIIAVVIVHSTMTFVINHEIGSLSWWIGNILDGSARWSVPIFFMISGMLLLGREESLKLIYKKRVMKLLIPLLFWSVFYSLWDLRYDFTGFSIREVAVELFTNNAKYHLWYLYAAIGLYIALPLFRVFVKHAKKQELLYIIVVSFIISALATTASKIYGLEVPVGFEYFLGYGSFFVLGYYLSVIEVKNSKLFFVAGIGALLTTIIGTWYISAIQGDLNQVFYEYLSFTTPLVALLVFLFTKKHMNHMVSKPASIIAQYSFGIYLLHPIFIDVLRSPELEEMIGMSVNQLPTLFNIGITLFLATLFSLFLASIMSKVPLINKLV